MLLFLYTADYDLDDTLNLDTHAKVYALGEKFMLPDLKASVVKKIIVFLGNTEWVDFAEELCMATKIAFNTTAPSDLGLRTPLIAAIHQCAKLNPLDDGMRDLIDNTNDLARGLWSKGLESVSGPQRCTICKVLKIARCDNSTPHESEAVQGGAVVRMYEVRCAFGYAVGCDCSPPYCTICKVFLDDKLGREW